MKRARTNARKDARIFRATANTTKKANVMATPMRGGIRL